MREQRIGLTDKALIVLHVAQEAVTQDDADMAAELHEQTGLPVVVLDDRVTLSALTDAQLRDLGLERANRGLLT